MKYRPEYNPKVIGENLRRLRKEKCLSVKEVQEYLRIGSAQAIYKYENGKGYPQADTMFALMELYEADINDIIHKHKTVIRHDNAKFDLYCIGEYLIPELNIIINRINIDVPKEQKKRFIHYYKHAESGIAG